MNQTAVPFMEICLCYSTHVFLQELKSKKSATRSSMMTLCRKYQKGLHARAVHQAGGCFIMYKLLGAQRARQGRAHHHELEKL